MRRSARFDPLCSSHPLFYACIFWPLLLPFPSPPHIVFVVLVVASYSRSFLVPTRAGRRKEWQWGYECCHGPLSQMPPPRCPSPRPSFPRTVCQLSLARTMCTSSSSCTRGDQSSLCTISLLRAFFFPEWKLRAKEKEQGKKTGEQEDSLLSLTQLLIFCRRSFSFHALSFFSVSALSLVSWTRRGCLCFLSARLETSTAICWEIWESVRDCERAAAKKVSIIRVFIYFFPCQSYYIYDEEFLYLLPAFVSSST